MTHDRLKETIEALKKICSPETPIFPDSRISEDLGLESIDFVEFVFELEKISSLRLDIVQMRIAITGGTEKRFREITVSDVANYIEKIEKGI